MLDEITLDPIVVSVAALLGVLLGLALGRFLLPGPRKVKRLLAEMEEMRREHAEYRTRVTGHFHKTSDLIGQMTASYKAVYDHLSEGAQTLCAGNALPPGAFSSPRLIVDETVDVSSEGVVAPARPATTQPAASGAMTESAAAAPVEAPAAGPAARPETSSQWRLDSSAASTSDTADATPSPQSEAEHAHETRSAV